MRRSWPGARRARRILQLLAVTCCTLWLATPAAAQTSQPAAGKDIGPAPAATPDRTASDQDDDQPDEAEAEPHTAGAPGEGLLRYSADLADAELTRLFVEDVPALGSISVGYTDAGRLINAVQLDDDAAWQVVVPEYAWGTQETIDALTRVASAVQTRYPQAPLLRVNHISKQEGGYLRPHKSHQSGRDVDLGFYYKPGVDPRGVRGSRVKSMDLALNWMLVRSLIIESDVQLILVDRQVRRALHDHALAQGEDRGWLDSIFNAGSASLVQHARRHRDHFHVRFYSPRAQELGCRVQPLLAKRPDENIAIYRVRRGDTLGHIAMRFNSSVSLIQKANHLRGTLLSVGRTLSVPLRGPCTNCPLPPPVVVPPRRLPPEAPPVVALTRNWRMPRFHRRPV